jgi:hypothetical protein
MGLGVKGELSVKRGEAEAGVHLLHVALDTLHAHRYELLTTAFNVTAVEGLASIGQFDQALEAIDQTIARVESKEIYFTCPNCYASRGICWRLLLDHACLRLRIFSYARLSWRANNLRWLGNCEPPLILHFAGPSKGILKKRGKCWRGLLIGSPKASKAPT